MKYTEYTEIEVFGHKYKVKLDETVMDGYIYLEDEDGKIILKVEVPEYTGEVRELLKMTKKIDCGNKNA